MHDKEAVKVNVDKVNEPWEDLDNSIWEISYTFRVYTRTKLNSLNLEVGQQSWLPAQWKIWAAV